VVTRRRGIAAGVAATTALAVAVGLAMPVARAGDDPPSPGGMGWLPIPAIPNIPIPPIPIPPLPIFPQPNPQNPPGPRPGQGCTTAGHPFVPTSVTLPGIADWIDVIALRRDANGNLGVPPLTDAGKTEMAFDLDSGIRPGDRKGNALFNAHTWPDGSALGNRLLADLGKGDQIVVRGKPGFICYEVTDRVEVPVTDKGDRFYATNGRPQIAIAVCSGRRLGPGRWTKRTLWFASPVD
jgi:hypothetical protein